MKKIVLIILIVVILGGGVFLIKKSNKDLNSIKGEFAENQKSVTENILPNDEIFEVKKIDSKTYAQDYTIEEQYKIISEKYFNIEKQKDNLVISMIDSEYNDELLSRGKGVEYNKKYTISNVKSEDVKSIFTGGEGQDLMYPLVYILMKDSTIKGVDIENGYKTGKFEAQIISGINNVEKIEQASVSPANDSGYEAIIAITEDEEVYEIRRK